MKKIIISAMMLTGSFTSFSQTYLDSTINSSTKRIQFANPNQFSIGSYGEAHYNQEIYTDDFSRGKADLHRIIMFMGYKFNNNLQFFSEIEFEHVQEVYVEQAFMNYSFNSLLNFKAGMILIPVGYVNEFHEPTLFNGVERPNFDKTIIPTTWREIGCGFHGLVRKANLKYQLYLVNGFKSYDGSGKLSGSGIRGGRQKGAEAMFNSPALTGKLTFYGLNGLRLGLSGYYGTTETTLYNGVDKDDNTAIQIADSSRVGIGLAALNLHYSLGNFRFMAVGSYTRISNANAYNTFTGQNLATDIAGFYTELAYHYRIKKQDDYPRLIPFVRYENYDTHYKVGSDITRNASLHKEELTAGMGFQVSPGAIFKADFQWVKSEANPRPYNVLNIGFGYWF